MRIIIEAPTYRLLNFGDTAMIIATVKRLNNLFPNSEISIFTEEPEKIIHLFSNKVKPIYVSKPDPRFREEQIFPDIFFKIVPEKHRVKIEGLEIHIVRKLPKLFAKLVKGINSFFNKKIFSSKIYEEIKKADMLVVSGGGFLTDSFFKHSKRALKSLKIASEMGKATVMFGQGVGPIADKKLYELLKENLQYIDMIGVREKKYSVNLLSSLGYKKERIKITGDDAIELAFCEKNNSTGSSIGVNIRTASYSNIDQREKDELSSFVVNKARELSAEILSLPILSETESSDIVTARKLFSRFRRFRDIEINYHEIERILKRFDRCRIVITGSYHAGVFALSRGIPVITLAKSNYYIYKFQGLADMFKAGCYVIPVYKKNYFDLLNKYFIEAWENSDSLRKTLLKNAEKQLKMNRSAYKELVDIVERKSQSISPYENVA